MNLVSHIKFANASGKYDRIWSILFRDLSFVDRWTSNGMKFLIIGCNLAAIFATNGLERLSSRPCRDLYLALLVVNESGLRLTQDDWNDFRRCLRAHEFNGDNHEMIFSKLNIRLNIDNLICHQETVVAEPDRLVHDYMQNRTTRTYSTCATTYAETRRGSSAGLRDEVSEYRRNCGYCIKLEVAGELRSWKIVPWWAASYDSSPARGHHLRPQDHGLGSLVTYVNDAPTDGLPRGLGAAVRRNPPVGRFRAFPRG
jgi:hypothetical protein